MTEYSMPQDNFHWPDSGPCSLPVPGDMPSPSLRCEIVLKTGIPEIQWAAMYLPVLSVVENVDQRWETETGLSYLIINRTQLASRLGISPGENFGVQLYKRDILTAREAMFLDEDFFRSPAAWRARFKIEDDCMLSVPQLISDLETAGLLERWWAVERCDSSYCANVGTTRLTELLQVLSTRQAILLSVNGVVSYS